MQINLQIHIHLDGVDLEQYMTRLGALFAPQQPQTAPEAFEGPDLHAQPITAQEDATALATATTVATDPTPPMGTAIGMVTSAPKGKKPKGVEKRPALLPGEVEMPEVGRLPFDQFDMLCRAEMKRLSMDKRMPNYSLWNSERDVRLPTMAGVLSRYGVTNLPDLAEQLEMLPPLSATGPRVAL